MIEKHPLETVRKALQIYADRFKNARGSQIPANNALIALTTYLCQPQSCAECERLGRENALLREVVRDFAGGIAESDCFNLDKLLQKHADTIAAAGGES